MGIFLFFRLLIKLGNKDSIKKTIEVGYILAAIATISSIFIALTTYYDNQKTSLRILGENKKLIFENLAVELEGNIGKLEYFEENIEGYKNRVDFYNAELSYYYMNLAIDFVENYHLRKVMIISIDDMQVWNRLSELSSSQSPGESRNKNIERMHQSDIKLLNTLIDINSTIYSLID